MRMIFSSDYLMSNLFPILLKFNKIICDQLTDLKGLKVTSNSFVFNNTNYFLVNLVGK